MVMAYAWEPGRDPTKKLPSRARAAALFCIIVQISAMFVMDSISNMPKKIWKRFVYRLAWNPKIRVESSRRHTQSIWTKETCVGSSNWVHSFYRTWNKLNSRTHHWSSILQRISFPSGSRIGGGSERFISKQCTWRHWVINYRSQGVCKVLSYLMCVDYSSA
jgi:hypothetical protein